MLDGVGTALCESSPFAGVFAETLFGLGIGSTNVHEQSMNKVVTEIDASLGVEGLPQSGTGQVSLLTGINAAKLMGRHYGPWPGPTIKPLLNDALPAQVVRAGGSVALVNYYPVQYFSAIENGSRKMGAIPLACKMAGVPMNGKILPPLTSPNTISLDTISLDTVRQWGRDFVQTNATLSIFDAWWSDHLGHKGSADAAALPEAKEYVKRLDAFCQGILEAQPADTLFVLTSDHGNFENMAVKTHTHSAVPFVAIGQGAHEFFGITDLTGVAPAMLRLFKLQSPK